MFESLSDKLSGIFDKLTRRGALSEADVTVLRDLAAEAVTQDQPVVLIGPHDLFAAPFAAHVMDGRTGKDIYSQNADARLHPASLTKMMTLYMAFTAIERGQVRLDSRFTVSSHAAGQPPSRLNVPFATFEALAELTQSCFQISFRRLTN